MTMDFAIYAASALKTSWPIREWPRIFSKAQMRSFCGASM